MNHVMLLDVYKREVSMATNDVAEGPSAIQFTCMY